MNRKTVMNWLGRNAGDMLIIWTVILGFIFVFFAPETFTP